MVRVDETWHRLREWTYGQPPAERMSAQILRAEGFTDLDPSHPLGGRDGGKDAIGMKGGHRWIMAAYFPRGQQVTGVITAKAVADAAGVKASDAYGMAFVTNQELRLAERRALEEAVGCPLELFHLERIASVLDTPGMSGVREQYLAIPAAGSAPARTPRQILDLSPTPRGSEHRMAFAGSLFLRIVAAPVPAVARYPAADVRPILSAASRAASATAAAWPANAVRLPQTLDDDWEPLRPHEWGVGWTSAREDHMRQAPTVAVALRTRGVAVTVERTWPTTVISDDGRVLYFAAREPEIAAESIVAVSLIAALLDPVGIPAVDIVLQIAAGGGKLVASERAVSGRRFGNPANYFKQPPAAEVPPIFLDSLRVPAAELGDPAGVAAQLLSGWLAMFRTEDLFVRLRDG